MESTCKFEEKGKCYRVECDYDRLCGCKDGMGGIRRASDRMIRIRKNRKIKEKSVIPKIVVMPPTVVNRDGDGNIKSININGSITTPIVRYYDKDGNEIFL